MKLTFPFQRSVIALSIIALFFSCKPKEEVTDDGSIPEENRFSVTTLTEPGKLDEPMILDFLPDGRVLFIERKGNLKSYSERANEIKILATIPVNTKYTSKEGDVREAEEGLMGLAVHPDFAKNHWIYMYYADPDEKKHVLARWELHDDSLYASTKKIILEVPTQREVCCHTGGGMAWDKEGNLFLTTGNNTGNPTAGTSGLDEREGRSSWDDQRTAGSTNDLRGKILRIHPEDDGTYTIPEGNLFPKGTDKTRPEIYTMGHRNPWRVSVDSKTNYIYWGEVGPDASKDSIIGPKGYDEMNQAKKAGFFGWPYFIGDNKPYAMFNYTTNEVGAKFDPEHPVNNSPNNTGLKELPLPTKAFIYYPYSTSEEFPLVGSSGRSATGGPVFRKADFQGKKGAFPSYYEGKWLTTEFMRGWIMSVTMDENGDFKSMEKFLPNENFSSAIDMKFGPEGDLYVLEYGSAWFRGNENAQIVRIHYNSGNRKPVVKASVDKVAGASPLEVKFSSEGTDDYDKYDKGALKYEWSIKKENKEVQKLTEVNPSFTFNEAGVYDVLFTVIDTKGEKNTQSLQVKVGNEPPAVALDITKGNKTFFFDKNSIDYNITVTDKEDGSTSDGKIPANEVAVNFDYAPQGFDIIEISQNHRSSDEWTEFSTGLNLINKNDCRSCHMIDKGSVGPSYIDVAKKYKNDLAAQERIAGKIITGGSGVWADHAMSAHPNVSPQDAATMVAYIMTLADKKPEVKAIPLTGKFVTATPTGDNGKGGYLLRAAYKDKGSNQLSSITSEKIVALRNPALDPEAADFTKGTVLMITPSRSFSLVGSGSYIGYKAIDFTDIKQLEFVVQAQPRTGAVGGVIEVHIDSPDGPIIGQSEQIIPKDVDFSKMMGGNNANKKKEEKKPAAKKPQQATGFDFSMLRRLMSIVINMNIQPTEGQHDVYFVFKNPKAKDNETIVQMVETVFRNTSAEAKPAKPL